MSFNNGNNHGHPFAKVNLDGYPFGYEQFLDSYKFDSDAAFAGPSRSQDWYHNPSPDGYTGQYGYQEHTLLDESGGRDTSLDGYGSNTPGRATTSPAEFAPVVGGVADAPRYLSFSPPAPQSVATSSGDNTPGPNYYAAPTLDPSYAAGTTQYGTSEHPLAGPSSARNWLHSHPTALDWFPPNPISAGNDAWSCQPPHASNSCGGSLPQMGPGVPLNAQPLMPSSGPQRAKQGAKGKMKVMQEGKGEQRKRSPTLPGAGSEWDETMDRLCRKLFETYHLEPAGGLINPEVAFAAIRKFVKEDLHRSPMAAEAAKAEIAWKGKSSRLCKQYLVHILMELHQPTGGEELGEKEIYRKVLLELETELLPVNERVVLWGRRANAKELSELVKPTKGAGSKGTQKRRRTAFRDLHDKISAFFLVKADGRISVVDLLLFVVVYLKIGIRAFPGLIRPRPLSHEQ